MSSAQVDLANDRDVAVEAGGAIGGLEAPDFLRNPRLGKADHPVVRRRSASPGDQSAFRRELEEAERFAVEAACVAAALDLGSAPLDPLFVREALRLLPESAGEAGALDKAKQFIKLTEPYISRCVHGL